MTTASTPLRFWINSQGEYGHDWPSGGATVGAGVNLREICEQYGIDWNEACHNLNLIPPRLVENAEVNALHAECINPSELILHRAWSSVQKFASSLWRFYASIDYTLDQHESLTMSIEHIIEESDLSAMHRTAAMCGAVVTEMHEDFENPDRVQVSVDWDLLTPKSRMSELELAALQLLWLRQARSAGLDANMVEVI